MFNLSRTVLSGNNVTSFARLIVRFLLRTHVRTNNNERWSRTQGGKPNHHHVLSTARVFRVMKRMS